MGGGGEGEKHPDNQSEIAGIEMKINSAPQTVIDFEKKKKVKKKKVGHWNISLCDSACMISYLFLWPQPGIKTMTQFGHTVVYQSGESTHITAMKVFILLGLLVAICKYWLAMHYSPLVFIITVQIGYRLSAVTPRMSALGRL